MKKKDLAMLALLGLTSGMMISCKTGQHKEGQPGKKDLPGKTAGQVAPSAQPMTAEEKAFYGKLNAEGKRTFEQMNSADRQKSIQTANAGCKGKNICKGLGGCETDDHACKGMNDCKGKGGCAVTDPNDAVQMTKQSTMQQKRNGMQK